jgi:hypothetical protein
MPHHSTASRTDIPSPSVIVRSASPSAPFRVTDRPVTFTERGQRLDRQAFEPAFPIGPFFTQDRLGIHRRPSRGLPHRLLTHHISPIGRSLSRKQLSTTRAATTDDLDPFYVPQPDFKIRCATHPMHRRK